MKVNISIELDPSTVPDTLLNLFNNLGSLITLTTTQSMVQEEDSETEEQDYEEESEYEEAQETSTRPSGEQHWSVIAKNILDAYRDRNMTLYNQLYSNASVGVQNYVTRKVRQTPITYSDTTSPTITKVSQLPQTGKFLKDLYSFEWNRFNIKYPNVSKELYTQEREVINNILDTTSKKELRLALTDLVKYRDEYNLTFKRAKQVHRAAKCYYYCQYTEKYIGIETCILSTSATVLAQRYNVSDRHIYTMLPAFE